MGLGPPESEVAKPSKLTATVFLPEGIGCGIDEFCRYLVDGARKLPVGQGHVLFGSPPGLMHSWPAETNHRKQGDENGETARRKCDSLGQLGQLQEQTRCDECKEGSGCNERPVHGPPQTFEAQHLALPEDFSVQPSQLFTFTQVMHRRISYHDSGSNAPGSGND
jgi:hypothetical protein